MAERFTFRLPEADEVVLREGDPPDAFYAIKSGRVEVYTEREGERVTLASLGPGEVFGEIAALRDTVRNASVRATEPCELLRMDAQELKRFLGAHPDIRARVEAQMNARLADTSRKMSYLDETLTDSLPAPEG